MKQSYKLTILLGNCVLAGAVFGCHLQSSESAKTVNAAPAEAKRITADSNTKKNENAGDKPQTNKSGELPVFKKSADYKKSVRREMLEAGWKPARSETDGRENCITESAVCREFPELEAGPSSPEGAAIFRWTKGEKTALIYTTGEPPVFVRAEIAENSRREPAKLAGKYLYKSKHESGEDTFLWELKPDFSASYKAVMEGGDGADLKGNWSSDAKSKIITVTLFGEQNEEEIYKFQLQGNDLKMIEDARRSNNYQGFTGIIFKRQ